MEMDSVDSTLDNPLAASLTTPDSSLEEQSYSEGERCTFTEEAENTLGRLRSSIAGLFRHIPGGLRKARDVEKLLGLDVKLSWQLFKLVSQSNTMAIVPHVPSAPSIKRLLKAAGTHGIDESAIAEVGKAYAAFEQLVDVHAGERVSFDAMTRNLIDDDESFQHDLQHRKSIFLGYRHIYGAQLDTNLTTLLIHPSAQGNYDYAYLRCKYGNQRLRKDAEFIMDRAKISPNTDNPDSLFDNAIHPEVARQYRIPIIPQFCSQPLPTFKTTLTPDGRSTTVVTGDRVGKRSSIDLVFGYLWRSVPLRSYAHVPGIGFGATSRMNHPTRMLYLDVFVHRASFPRLTEHFAVYGHTSLTEEPNKIFESRSPLPFREKPARIGHGLNNVYVPEVPMYGELVQSVCTRLAWNVDDFDVYRVRIEYPLLDSMISYWFSLPS
jgi:hypothetical protein